jgi:hypothetical protein
MCQSGSIAGYAQVPGDVAAAWTDVGGYGHSLFEGGPYPGIFRCTEYTPQARQVSTGVYLVTLNVGCGGASLPPGGMLPAVVTVTSEQELVGTYTTICDGNDKGWEQRVQIRAPDGTPTSADFTIEELAPVAVLAP